VNGWRNWKHFATETELRWQNARKTKSGNRPHFENPRFELCAFEYNFTFNTFIEIFVTF
jgi:hypothetical protein